MHASGGSRLVLVGQKEKLHKRLTAKPLDPKPESFLFFGRERLKSKILHPIKALI
jgi:hypothetical protein